MKGLIRGLEGINLIGADIVEVSPPYDTMAEVTCIAATDLLVDIMALMVKDTGRSQKDQLKDEL